MIDLEKTFKSTRCVSRVKIEGGGKNLKDYLLPEVEIIGFLNDEILTMSGEVELEWPEEWN